MNYVTCTVDVDVDVDEMLYAMRTSEREALCARLIEEGYNVAAVPVHIQIDAPGPTAAKVAEALSRIANGYVQLTDSQIAQLLAIADTVV